MKIVQKPLYTREWGKIMCQSIVLILGLVVILHFYLAFPIYLSKQISYDLSHQISFLTNIVQVRGPSDEPSFHLSFKNSIIFAFIYTSAIQDYILVFSTVNRVSWPQYTPRDICCIESYASTKFQFQKDKHRIYIFIACSQIRSLWVQPFKTHNINKTSN